MFLKATQQLQLPGNGTQSDEGSLHQWDAASLLGLLCQAAQVTDDHLIWTAVGLHAVWCNQLS